MSGNFRAQTRQATANHFGDGFVWQLPSPEAASTSESFRRRFCLASSEPRRGKEQRVISATVLSGNFRARTRQTTTNHFGDAFGWQLLSPDGASNNESFRRTVLSGNCRAQTGQATTSHSGDAFGWQLLSPDGATTASHFGDALGWQLLSPDGATGSHFGDAFGWQLLGPGGASNSESFRRRFWLATSEPGRGKQQRVISATLLAGNF